MPDALSTEHLHRDLRGRSVRGSVVTLTSQGSKYLLQTVSTIVLARLLTPADFGLVAMVTAVTGLGEAFAGLGLSEATIQSEHINQDQVTNLFWLNVAIGLALTLVTVALAPFMVWFYRDPRLKDITLVLALTFLIGGLRVQHEALLKRQMRFFALAVRNVASYVLGVPIAIVMAWKGAGYWAIVALPLIMNFTQMVLSWVLSGWLPGLPRRGTKVRSMVSFGGRVAASYLTSNASLGASNALVGWWWGAGPLGLFSRAYNLLTLPVQQLNMPLGTVLVPTLSRLQFDRERFTRYILRTANLMMWVIAPMFGFLFVGAEPVILLVLGKQWVGAAPVFQYLVIAGLVRPLSQLANWSMVSRGESHRLLKLQIWTFPIVVGGFAIGLPFGIKAVALCGSVVQLCTLPWRLSYTFPGTTLTLRLLGRAILCPVALGLAGVCLAECMRHFIAPQGLIPQLLVDALGFALVFSGSIAVPSVRREVASLRGLLGTLRLAKQAA
jgi:O-antigen/teichoic acid export membrane protein